MQSINSLGSSHNHLSPKKTVRPTNFICIVPGCTAVSLIGDFNDWHPNANPMQQHFDGSWQIQFPLSHGHHHYAFYADGNILLDPKAHGVARDAEGKKVSLIAVS
ncbi:MAG: glycoside hydrolase family 13 [Pedosphaera sp.]|nr:glycoside hydrolase family 13 [Pedosphaera sp.]